MANAVVVVAVAGVRQHVLMVDGRVGRLCFLLEDLSGEGDDDGDDGADAISGCDVDPVKVASLTARHVGDIAN